jgi:hypothetical protein
MRKHANGNKYVPCHAAPKRTSLQMFGGPLTIDEFRHSSSNVFVQMPWETHSMPVITISNAPVGRTLPGAMSDDSMVLKRTKPLPRAKSSLEAALGITRMQR